MEKKEIEDKIKAFLAQESPEYFAGVELYEQHPEAKKNLIINFRQRYNKGSMHEKLVYELEKMIGAQVYSNRSTVLGGSPANIPYKLIKETKAEAPENYEYKVKYENLPEELKKKVIEKGQLYTYLEKLKLLLAEVGQANDEKSIESRKVIMDRMHDTVDRIKEIHTELMQFEEVGTFQGFESIISSKGVEIPIPKLDKPLPISEIPDLIDIELENEFSYLQMSYYQLKDLLIKLRSAVPKQEQRAKESKKPDVIKSNEQKAQLGRKMIALLVRYFEENKEA
jgi:hypothetical protein